MTQKFLGKYLMTYFLRMMMVFLLVLGSASAFSRELPVWEAGVGGAGFSMSHYLGADESSQYSFAYPFFIYRSEYVQAGREGLRGKLFQRKNVRLTISLNASLPVNSEDNDAREEMPDLDPMLEIGPMLQYRLYQNESNDSRITLDLPLRAALTIDDFEISHRGWITNPSVVYSGGDSRWSHKVAVGPMFADHRYHGYFYDVGAEYVTPERGLYNAKAGYTGAKLSLSLRRKFGDFAVAGFVRYVNLSGVANEESDLIKSDDYLAFGIAMHWRLAQSPNKVSVRTGF